MEFETFSWQRTINKSDLRLLVTKIILCRISTVDKQTVDILCCLLKVLVHVRSTFVSTSNNGGEQPNTDDRYSTEAQSSKFHQGYFGTLSLVISLRAEYLHHLLPSCEYCSNSNS